MKVLEVKGLNVYANHLSLIKDISFSLYQNEIVTIVGPSGAGKSTLLRVFNRLADQESKFKVEGSILYQGEDIFTCCPVDDLRRHIGFVFQRPCVFPGSIRRNVLFGIRHHKKLSKSEGDQLVESVLEKAHLWNEVKDRLHHPAIQLSIGQKQRLVFARTFAVDPEILLLDEPTSSLDPHSTFEIEKALLQMKNSKSILMVTHLIEQGRRISDRIIFLSAKNGYGQIIEQGSVEDIFENPQREETRHYLLTQK